MNLTSSSTLSSLISKDIYIQVTDYINDKEREDDLDRYPRAIIIIIFSLIETLPLSLKKLVTERDSAGSDYSGKQVIIILFNKSRNL